MHGFGAINSPLARLLHSTTHAWNSYSRMTKVFTHTSKILNIEPIKYNKVTKLNHYHLYVIIHTLALSFCLGYPRITFSIFKPSALIELISYRFASQATAVCHSCRAKGTLGYGGVARRVTAYSLSSGFTAVETDPLM